MAIELHFANVLQKSDFRDVAEVKRKTGNKLGIFATNGGDPYGAFARNQFGLWCLCARDV
ncbi:hypothetical protein AGR7A_pAt10067 [Agrobacterium deltaense NCPPB 1641]|uniref:Uncharacterized protein n=1 Tax=Agrobacterium deltaense NCPPB 1641 TaxID=1183425 RepID=A0A1S7U7E8_9HYPH|nr:hypothetical protein AGR7A_pAt10067 [Agrobacterium deltaense NCPPB 1641]